MLMNHLVAFIKESNRIEGIDYVKEDEVAAYFIFLSFDELSVYNLMHLLEVIQPGAELRCKPGMNVTVGNHKPAPGGPMIEIQLRSMLRHWSDWSPFYFHVDYEKLHPFTDGNGRTGRAIWLWQMVKAYDYDCSLGFLHKFYYQALEAK